MICCGNTLKNGVKTKTTIAVTFAMGTHYNKKAQTTTLFLKHDATNRTTDAKETQKNQAIQTPFQKKSKENQIKFQRQHGEKIYFFALQPDGLNQAVQKKTKQQTNQKKKKESLTKKQRTETNQSRDAIKDA